MEQNKQETVFLNGFIFKRPKEGAPDFVKGEMAINVADAVKFLQENNNNGWVNADLLASKDNSKLYFKLNTWKPKVDETNPAQANSTPSSAPVEDTQEPLDDKSIPF